MEFYNYCLFINAGLGFESYPSIFKLVLFQIALFSKLKINVTNLFFF